MTTVTRSGLTGFFFKKKPVRSGSSSKKTRYGAVRSGPPSKKPQFGPVPGVHPRSTGTGNRYRTRSVFWTSPSVTMGVDDGVEDWNSESGEDYGDGAGREDEVEEVIQTTSGAGGSAKYILLLPESNEDKENKAGHDLKTPKESVEQSMGGRINCGTVRS